MSRYGLPLALLAVLLVLSGCASPSRGERNTLIYGTPFEPNTINPITAPDVVSRTVIEMIFDGLVAADEQLNLRGELATGWDTSPDGKSWVFHLREGVRWHDGEPFTAEDVKFTYETVIDPATTPTVAKADYAGIAGIDVIDSHTIRFRLEAPNAAFLSRLVLGIGPKHLLEGEDLATTPFNQHPVGTGPFAFERWSKGESIVLRRNAGYFGSQPKLQEIIWKIVPDSSMLAIQAANGEVDGAPLFNPRDAERMRTSAQSTIFETFEGNTQISLQMSNPLFQDVRVRQALALGIDTREIIDRVMQGSAVVATSDISPASWAYEPNVPTYPYDPARARMLLEEAGWKRGPAGVLERDGKPFRITLMTDAGHKVREQVMLAVRQYWEDLRIEVTTGVQERNSFVFQRVLKGDFDAVLLQSSVQIDPDISRRFHSRSILNGQNFLNYSNSEVDQLLDEGLVTSNQPARREIYSEVQKLLAEDLPQISLFYPKATYAFNPAIGGVLPSPANLFWNAEEWGWRR